jgi:hypothetical protein
MEQKDQEIGKVEGGFGHTFLTFLIFLVSLSRGCL